MLTAGLTVLLVAGLAPLRADAQRDPRWVFYSRDRTHYTSPWFAGAHRIMVPFGCTRAPYYSPDPRCPDGHGFHHGIDIAMPCGTELSVALGATVVDHSSLGPAYGENPVLLRNRRQGWDLVIGHTSTVYAEVGDHLRPGTVFALASDSGAPDGCHLHFEQRTVRGGLETAHSPRRLLALAAPAPEGAAS